MTADDREMTRILVKAAAEQGVRQGALAMNLPEEVARVLANQLSFTMELLEQGKNLTPRYLAVLLAEKSLATAGLVLPHRYECHLTICLVFASLTKSFPLLLAGGPGALVFQAAGLLVDVWSIDKACGVSDRVVKHVEATVQPFAVWLDQGVMEWLRHPR